MRTFKVLCNVCDVEIEVDQPDDAEVAVMFDGDLSGRIDLCEECRIAWRRDIENLLEGALPYKKPKIVAGGSTRKAPALIEQKPFGCTHRGCKAAFTTQRGLTRHKTSMGH